MRRRALTLPVALPPNGYLHEELIYSPRPAPPSVDDDDGGGSSASDTTRSGSGTKRIASDGPTHSANGGSRSRPRANTHSFVMPSRLPPLLGRVDAQETSGAIGGGEPATHHRKDEEHHGDDSITTATTTSTADESICPQTDSDSLGGGGGGGGRYHFPGEPSGPRVLVARPDAEDVISGCLGVHLDSFLASIPRTSSSGRSATLERQLDLRGSAVSAVRPPLRFASPAGVHFVVMDSKQIIQYSPKYAAREDVVELLGNTAEAAESADLSFRDVADAAVELNNLASRLARSCRGPIKSFINRDDVLSEMLWFVVNQGRDFVLPRSILSPPPHPDVLRSKLAIDLLVREAAYPFLFLDQSNRCKVILYLLGLYVYAHQNTPDTCDGDGDDDGDDDDDDDVHMDSPRAYSAPPRQVSMLVQAFAFHPRSKGLTTRLLVDHVDPQSFFESTLKHCEHHSVSDVLLTLTCGISPLAPETFRPSGGPKNVMVPLRYCSGKHSDAVEFDRWMSNGQFISMLLSEMCNACAPIARVEHLAEVLDTLLSAAARQISSAAPPSDEELQAMIDELASSDLTDDELDRLFFRVDPNATRRDALLPPCVLSNLCDAMTTFIPEVFSIKDPRAAANCIGALRSLLRYCEALYVRLISDMHKSKRGKRPPSSSTADKSLQDSQLPSKGLLCTLTEALTRSMPSYASQLAKACTSKQRGSSTLRVDMVAFLAQAVDTIRRAPLVVVPLDLRVNLLSALETEGVWTRIWHMCFTQYRGNNVLHRQVYLLTKSIFELRSKRLLEIKMNLLRDGMIPAILEMEAENRSLCDSKGLGWRMCCIGLSTQLSVLARKFCQKQPLFRESVMENFGDDWRSHMDLLDARLEECYFSVYPSKS